MKRILILLPLLAYPSLSPAQNPDSVWRQFTGELFRGAITADRIRPYHPSLTEPMLGYLQTLRTETAREEWQRKPEVHQVGDLIHYILPLTAGADTSVICFTIRTEGHEWYFAHMENIFIRLDTLGALPASSFPDLPEPTKAWMREEGHWSFIVNLYGVIKQDRGREYALDLLKDGAGYFLAAKACVPFVPARRAFVLYLCWEQSVLRGNRVTLEKLSDSLARVSTTPMFLQLYKRAAHLQGQISPEEYRGMFEMIWQDRAKAAGWRLDIEYLTDEEALFTLR